MKRIIAAVILAAFVAPVLAQRVPPAPPTPVPAPPAPCTSTTKICP